MGSGVVHEFCHGEEFRPFRRLVFSKDPKEGFEFLVDSFGFAINLRVVGCGEGNVIFQEVCELSCEGRGKLGSSVRDDSVMKAESRENVFEKDLGNVHGRGHFVAGAENYPLQKAMVDHDQNGVKAMGFG